jgi:protein-S-isoprenylcysteine O-methyltransferase Ste14
VSDPHTRPASLPWPPIVYAAAILLAIILALWVPLPWISGIFAEFMFAVGCLLLAGGIAMIALAIRALSRSGTTVSPLRSATHLVTSGPYAISRNPIYLGNTMVLIAIALIAHNPWFIVMGFAAAIATSYLAIRPEEKHLDLRFGRRYRDYAKRVRRWI